MKIQNIYFLITATILLLPACSEKKDPIDTTTSSNSVAAPMISTDKWLGKWNGPEGTFIEITGGYGNYSITIQNLDGPQKFRGNNQGDHIVFERNGIQEKLSASNGADTGMKWLAEKSTCLKLRPGEGWCRD